MYAYFSGIDLNENCQKQNSMIVTYDQCKDNNARCSVDDNKCTCIKGYHPEPSDDTAQSCEAGK